MSTQNLYSKCHAKVDSDEKMEKLKHSLESKLEALLKEKKENYLWKIEHIQKNFKRALIISQESHEREIFLNAQIQLISSYLVNYFGWDNKEMNDWMYNICDI